MDSNPHPTPAEMAVMHEEIRAERVDLHRAAGADLDPQRREDLRQCRMFGTRAIDGDHTPEDAVRIAIALMSLGLPDLHVSPVTNKVIDLNPHPRDVRPLAVVRALSTFSDHWQRAGVPSAAQAAAAARTPGLVQA